MSSSTALTSAANPIRILIVDDHPLILAGLSDTIASERDMQVVGELGTATYLVDTFTALRPDITIMDIALPGIDGLQALAALRRAHSQARVIMLTSLQGDHQAHRAIELGAAGFLMKHSVRKDLITAVRAVHAGQRWICADAARKLAEHVSQSTLSEREIEVLRSASAGNSNKRIGSHLGIAEDTVKAHIRTILSKLGAQDRTHAVAIAVKRGIISL